ncbi:hypothetical protein [Effusibacillus consociatus]|uniref:Uncharacterized protein n=1 Tax=Effusibacillus consociatus TaxID=1117041 RepID=A0ABV9Q7Y5_9BACL
MLNTIVAYSLFFETVLGFATIFWWWKRCDKVEKIFMLLHLSGASLFAYSMLL